MSIAKSGSDSIQIMWRLGDWFPDLGKDEIERLRGFHEMLLKFNKAINLISVKTIPIADLVHFSDCVLASRVIHDSVGDVEIFDLGSGNGFPGIIYGILFPKSKVILVEPDTRKAEFLKHAVSSFKLANCSVMMRRVEDLGPNSISFAMSRGFSAIAKAILITRKCFKVGGSYFHLKSEEWASEVGNIPIQLCSFWKPELVSEYKLPVGVTRFSVVKTLKVKD